MPIIPDDPRITSSSGPRFFLSRPVSGDSLRFFRVVFGAVVCFSALRLLWLDWPATLYSAPRFHFSYAGMGWVPVPPVPLMRILVAVIALAAVAFAVGYRYRLAIGTVWLLFTWMEFSEATVYLNHYWFISVMSALMIVLPFDARGSVPLGAVWLVRFQVAVVYCFAGLAKLNTDWLIHGLPMALWLPAKSDLPLIGGLLGHHSSAIALSWAGALFDCTIVAFLLWKRTRLFAWLAVLGFHLATWLLFPVIGVFPFLMIGASLIFFEPDWPARLRSRIADGRVPAPIPESNSRLAESNRRRVSGLVLAVAVVWICVQVLVPLRQFVIPGDARWTGEGFRFSWNVLAVEKAGDLSFRITDTRTGDTRRTRAEDLFTPQQLRVVSTEPELIRQAAHHIADVESKRSGSPRYEIEVRVDSFVSVNGRAALRLIEPDVNLAAEPARFGHQRWITAGQ